MTYIIPAQTLNALLKIGNRALNGDSNDAEHDALYELVEALEEVKGLGRKPRSKETAVQ